MRYAQALIAQLTHSAVCHGHHRLEQQFRRLLLVSMDLLRSNDIALTQDAIACLLGARRESITAVAGKLQSAGLIRYHRGRITILDRRVWRRKSASAMRPRNRKSIARFRGASRRRAPPRWPASCGTPWPAMVPVTAISSRPARRISTTRAASGLPLYRELAAERIRSLAHRHESMRGGVVPFREIDADAVIGDAEQPLISVLLERDRHVFRLRIFGDVGQRFLHDAIKRDAVRRR